MSSWMRLLSLLRPYPLRITLVLLLGSLSILSNIGLMVVSAYLLSRAALQPPIFELIAVVVAVRFFGISRAVFRYLERLMSHDLTFRILQHIRTSFYQRLEPLAPAKLLRYRSADLFSRIVSDVDTLQNFFLRVATPSLTAAVILVAYLLFLSWFDPLLALGFSAFYLLGGVGVPLGIRALGQQTQAKRSELQAQLRAALLDSVQGMTELLVFGAPDEQEKRVFKLQNELQALQRKQAWLSGMASGLTGLSMHLAMGSVLVLAVLDVAQGRVNGVFLAALPLGVLSSFEAVFPLGLFFPYYEHSRGAAKRLMEFEVPLVDADDVATIGNEVGIETSDRTPLLRVEHLAFRYESTGPWVLEDVSFEIFAGKKVALVGANGAGKSTLVNLLLCFWRSERGGVYLAGQNSRRLSEAQNREFFGVVPQSTHLFNATLRENLILAKLDATDQELNEAMRKAHLLDWIQRAPDGYDTYIGEDGLKLSGGQRQRLAIARALLKNAPLLILDEATSGLEPATEMAIFHELKPLFHGRTVLVITHHLDILPEMDEVLLLAHGRIVERGPHIELLRKQGEYARLWSLGRE